MLADGKYVADGDGPKEVNGYFQVRTPTGDAPNPLWQLDGSLDLLAQPTRSPTRSTPSSTPGTTSKHEEGPR